ncbi:hypothetical protein DUNSADRAFT_12182 [Dunaliella salina]|uniref:Encoded protein n=1 Tax=Dunaliella salina TaxID=3046 RepID=A0ABQ7GBS9_DUNSA|nr:hypothetical protein DUNSADRAFT_12182 [Dunaliella salina]|eukprot:KAF5832069.1 hypothetical protein DUNSADRAFT_12182 [Dunaliella salina]
MLLHKTSANPQFTRHSRPKLVPRCQPPLPHRRYRISLPMASAAQQAPLSQAKYSAELAAAADAVRLASRVCETVQKDLAESEKADKQDDSPVTVADYAAQAVVAWSLSRSQAATQGARLCMVAEEDSSSFNRRPPHSRISDKHKFCISGSVSTTES